MASKTDTLWRVQVRKSRNHAWQNKGLFETRMVARAEAAFQRIMGLFAGKGHYKGYGFGNTRVVRHVRGGGR